MLTWRVLAGETHVARRRAAMLTVHARRTTWLCAGRGALAAVAQRDAAVAAGEGLPAGLAARAAAHVARDVPHLTMATNAQSVDQLAAQWVITEVA